MNHPSLPLQAVVFDWAGTVIDFGSLAPMDAFVQLFARYGVRIDGSGECVRLREQNLTHAPERPSGPPSVTAAKKAPSAPAAAAPTPARPA